ncbi:uncharacterized protein EI97DRAFT_440450 [Westerdykella ornata]|uniref:SWIM-type domain-containing protein n=1 Tax=Westerdykella ornata TaxID=318751 RepID=A0A6A6JRQ7_WESOR|nr:uncharacterized protein EI97DRAFT_440450 [Westerdykella ornata]KAF2278954.1 hypothetical protein EI97DRAFT_440450 [Westerdykella ornata]
MGKAYSRVPQRLNLPEFQVLHNKVTPIALDLLKEQISLAKNEQQYRPGCTGSFTKKYGLPCCHTLHQRAHRSAQNEINITFEEIHPHWHYYPQRSSIQILSAVVPRDPATVKGKGRPRKQKTCTQNNNSMTSRPSALTDSQREPSSFEIVAATQVTATQLSHTSHTPGNGHAVDGGQSLGVLTVNSTVNPTLGNTASQPIEIGNSTPAATYQTVIAPTSTSTGPAGLSQVNEEVGIALAGKRKRGRPLGSKDKQPHKYKALPAVPEPVPEQDGV